jgi:hypothetical protein
LCADALSRRGAAAVAEAEAEAEAEADAENVSAAIAAEEEGAGFSSAELPPLPAAKGLPRGSTRLFLPCQVQRALRADKDVDFGMPETVQELVDRGHVLLIPLNDDVVPRTLEAQGEDDKGTPGLFDARVDQTRKTDRFVARLGPRANSVIAGAIGGHFVAVDVDKDGNPVAPGDGSDTLKVSALPPTLGGHALFYAHAKKSARAAKESAVSSAQTQMSFHGDAHSLLDVAGKFLIPKTRAGEYFLHLRLPNGQRGCIHVPAGYGIWVDGFALGMVEGGVYHAVGGLEIEVDDVARQERQRLGAESFAALVEIATLRLSGKLLSSAEKALVAKEDAWLLQFIQNVDRVTFQTFLRVREGQALAVLNATKPVLLGPADTVAGGRYTVEFTPGADTAPIPVSLPASAKFSDVTRMVLATEEMRQYSAYRQALRVTSMVRSYGRNPPVGGFPGAKAATAFADSFINGVRRGISASGAVNGVVRAMLVTVGVVLGNGGDVREIKAYRHGLRIASMVRSYGFIPPVGGFPGAEAATAFAQFFIQHVRDADCACGAVNGVVRAMLVTVGVVLGNGGDVKDIKSYRQALRVASMVRSYGRNPPVGGYPGAKAATAFAEDFFRSVRKGASASGAVNGVVLAMFVTVGIFTEAVAAVARRVVQEKDEKKSEKKAQKDAEKAAKKAEKDAEKAAKKAEKDAEKAAKAAEKAQPAKKRRTV